MSIPVIAFSAGLFLIVVAVIGGGLEVKEVKIPSLGLVPRLLSFGLGCILVGICVLRPIWLPGIQSVEDLPSKPTDARLPVGKQRDVGGEEPYKFENDVDVGATFGFPNNVLSVNSTTESITHQLLLRDGDGQIRAKITRSAFVDTKDAKVGRAKEKEELERVGYFLTYVAPKDGSWSNWYALSGVSNNTVIYVKRWYLKDGIGSIEFTFPKELSSVYDPIITTMVHNLFFAYTLPEGEHQ